MLGTPEILACAQLMSLTDELSDFYRQWERWAADAQESHASCPGLMPFRSPSIYSSRASLSWASATLQPFFTPSHRSKRLLKRDLHSAWAASVFGGSAPHLAISSTRIRLRLIQSLSRARHRSTRCGETAHGAQS